MSNKFMKLLYHTNASRALDCLLTLELARVGGERGIRTLDTLSDILPFQGSPFDRSGISPFFIY